MKQKKETPEELKLKRIRKKAERNASKCFATTKSFNNRKNDFIPEVDEVRNPDAVMYLQLKNKGMLTLKKKKPISYKEWQKELMDKALKQA